MKTRTVILGYDGLEHSLVEKFNLEGLKQKEYGTVDISDVVKYPYEGYIATPVIWASFITGLPPQIHQVDAFTTWENPTIRKLKRISVKLGLWRIKGKGTPLRALGFKKTSHTKKDFKKKNIKTIFDIVENSVAINVPSYQLFMDEEMGTLLEETIKNPVLEEKFDDKVWEEFEEDRKTCLRNIEKKDWKLFMMHFHIADHFGHIHLGELDKMREVYIALDNLTKEVKEILGDQVFLLIISDHGITLIGKKYGEHAGPAFYSSNLFLGLQNPKMTEFKDIILDAVNDRLKERKPPKGLQKEKPKERRKEVITDKEERERLHKRLKELGYF